MPWETFCAQLLNSTFSGSNRDEAFHDREGACRLRVSVCSPLRSKPRLWQPSPGFSEFINIVQLSRLQKKMPRRNNEAVRDSGIKTFKTKSQSSGNEEAAAKAAVGLTAYLHNVGLNALRRNISLFGTRPEPSPFSSGADTTQIISKYKLSRRHSLNGKRLWLARTRCPARTPH